MKIGILTFYSQLNYISPGGVARAAIGRRYVGCGVLQCWALQNALTRILSEKCEVRSEKCGNGVMVIDRWLSRDPVRRERFLALLKTRIFSRALRIAEIGRKAELKEFYYSSHPWLVNSLPMRVVRWGRRVVRSEE